MAVLAPAEAARVAAASPASFAHIASSGRWIPYEHLLLLNDRLMRVAAGEIDRLIVTMPPRHGKSELVSRYTPAWYLGTFPERQVIMTSYDKLLIQDHSNAARELLEVHGPGVFGVAPRPNGAGGRWHLQDHDGVLVASSLRGGITGRGAHLLIIDDPFKDELDAASELKRERVWTWWQATSSTRLMPGASAVILVQTRWHEDDLAGRLLAGDEEWEQLNLPALAESDEDPLGRQEGAALCPELFDETAFARIRKTSGSYFFAALYQQRPTPAEGFMFKRQHFRYWRQLQVVAGAITSNLVLLRREDQDTDRRFDLDQCPMFQTVDVALSEKTEADWTVVSTWRKTPDGDLLLLDVQRQHFETQQVTMFLERCNDRHGRPPMWVEKFGAGRSPLAMVRNAGYPVMELPEEAGTKLDKITRAFGAIAMYEAHRVWHPHPTVANAQQANGEWLVVFEDELCGFNKAKHDDQVDTVSYAARLSGLRPADEEVVRPRRVTHFSRDRFPG